MSSYSVLIKKNECISNALINAHYTKLVGDEQPDQLTVGMTDMIPMMINAIKELSTKVETLQSEINTLKGG